MSKNSLESFSGWLKRYRLIIMIVAIIIVVLLTLIITYASSYAKYSRVHFDTEATESSVYIEKKKILKGLENDELRLSYHHINKKHAKKTINDKDEVIYKDGYYEFNTVKYQGKSGYNISNVAVTPLATSHWSDSRGVSYQSSISESGTSLKINYNFPHPIKGMWPFSDYEAHIYFKVTYSVKGVVGGEESKTAYFKLDIDWKGKDIVVIPS